METFRPSSMASQGAWRDLERDWLRWSRTERLAAECLAATALLAGAIFLAAFTFR